RARVRRYASIPPSPPAPLRSDPTPSDGRFAAGVEAPAPLPAHTESAIQRTHGNSPAGECLSLCVIRGLISESAKEVLESEYEFLGIALNEFLGRLVLDIIEEFLDNLRVQESILIDNGGQIPKHANGVHGHSPIFRVGLHPEQ